MRARRRDGSWRWIESTTTNLLHDPAVHALVSNYRDITERKAAESAMLETQRRLQYLLSATSAITYSARVGLTKGTTFISANVKTMLGYEPQDFYDDPTFWFERIHPDNQARVQSDSHTARAKGVHTFEYRFRHRDDSYRWMRDDARVIRDESGAPLEIVGYWVDVTEQTRAEIQLRRSEANFRMMIERSPTATFVHRGGHYIYVNPAAVALLGYARRRHGRQVGVRLHPRRGSRGDPRAPADERGAGRGGLGRGTHDPARRQRHRGRGRPHAARLRWRAVERRGRS